MTFRFYVLLFWSLFLLLGCNKEETNRSFSGMKFDASHFTLLEGVNCDLNSIEALPSGGFMVVGRAGLDGVPIYALDDNYTILWEHQFDNLFSVEAQKILVHSNGKLSVLGHARVSGNRLSPFHASFNPDGFLNSVRTYGDENERLEDAVLDENGDIIMIGTNIENSLTGRIAVLRRIDAQGMILSNSEVTLTNNNSGHGIERMDNGNFGIVLSDFPSTFSSQLILAEVDKEFNLIWSSSFESFNSIGSFQMALTNDGGLIGLGKTTDNTLASIDGFQLIKVDGEGTEVWRKDFTEEGFLTYNLHKVEDGYLVLSTSSNFTVDSDWYLLKVDFEGNLIWQNTYGDIGTDLPQDFIETENGYLLCGGSIAAATDGEFSAVLLKIDRNGNPL